MIKINRGPAPEYLMSNRVLLAKKKLEEKFSDKSRQERFKFDLSIFKSVKEDLMKLSNSKCSFCESKLKGASIFEIENFRPKGGARGFDSKEYAPVHYWWLAYEWENLLITCQLCNRHKRDLFPLENENFRSRIGAVGKELLLEKPLLIDPSSDNPDEHLDFDENGFAIDLTLRGKVSIEVYGLNRSELVSSRKEVARNFSEKLEIMANDKSSSDQFTTNLLLYVKDLFSESPPQEFAALQQSIFDRWYEQNSARWEKAKEIQNDVSETIRHRKIENSDVSLDPNERKEVESKLSAIKRFSIRKINILNFKSIENLTLNVKAVNENEIRESWLLMLGDNGIGKSTILQAIALCLCTKKQLEKLKLNVKDFLRRGATSGMVEIFSYEHDEPIVLELGIHGFNSKLNEAPTFILGYGTTRLLPKGNILEDKNKEPYLNIRNLFDYSTALNNPNTWLGKIGIEEFNTRVAPVFFDILALRENDRIYFEKGRIKLKQFGEDQDLESNSDGYKTIAALVSDIMETLSLERANYHNSQGIVLIDEIGNHLHPRWRMKIIGSLRRAFPNLQFIVTTHEPLCLRGMLHGEVNVLVRDAKGSIKALDGELLPDHNLMRIDQLLTSDLFGLINILDEETEKTYEEYYNLLGKKDQDKSSEDRIKIQQLSSKLSEKGMLGSTPREQIMFKLIDEVFAEKIRVDGFKTQVDLKNETVTEVKSIITNKSKDWL